jgi:hypothetical protein
MSRRAWCRESGPPRSRKAFRSNPSLPTKSNLWILFHADMTECGRAGHAPGCKAQGRSCSMRVRRDPGSRQIPRRDSDQSLIGQIGCKARQVRLTHAGVGSFPVATPRNRKRQLPGARMKSVPHEKLNDERGVKPLPVNRSRDGAETGQCFARMGKGPLLYSCPRNDPASAGSKL